MKHQRRLLLVGVLLMMSAVSASADWLAGRDLKANELPNGNGVEQIDPNPTVPEWSYGYRGTLNSTELTLFTTGQHFNVFNGSSDLQGFSLANGNDSVVNTGSSDVVINFGSGPLNPLHPGDMWLHPGPDASNTFEVVRWAAPASGTYSISAFWSDLDPHSASGTNGAEGAITLNGNSLFDVTFANGAGTSTSLTQTLVAGDLIDFLLGSAGDYRFDATAFNATITLVPEPTTTSSFIAGAALLGGSLYLRRRRYAR